MYTIVQRYPAKKEGDSVPSSSPDPSPATRCNEDGVKRCNDNFYMTEGLLVRIKLGGAKLCGSRKDGARWRLSVFGLPKMLRSSRGTCLGSFRQPWARRTTRGTDSHIPIRLFSGVMRRRTIWFTQ